MTSYEFWTIVGMIGGSFAWLNYQMHEMRKDINRIENTHGERLSRIEIKIENQQRDIDWLKGMMNTIVSFLLGHKTGS